MVEKKHNPLSSPLAAVVTQPPAGRWFHRSELYVIGIAFHCLHSPRRTAGCRRTCHGFSLHNELILLLQLPAWTVSTPLFNFFRLTCSPVILLHNPNTRLSPVLVSSGSPKSSTPDLSLGSKGFCTCLITVSLNLVNSSFPSIKREERCGPTGSLT